MRTAIVIPANKIAPGVGDWYLARQGYGAQQYDGYADPNRPNNLYQPVDDDRDFGAHGDFDQRAASFSPQLWSDQHRNLLLAGAGVAGLLGWALWRSARNGNSRSSERLPRRRATAASVR